VSTCRKRPEDDCRKTYRCSYTNGQKRQFCRLSSKYKMNKQTCNVTRRFTKKTAASRIQQFIRSRRNRKSPEKVSSVIPKKRSPKKVSKILKNKKSPKKVPVTPVRVPGPTDLEIQEFRNKVHARRLLRFMKKVDPTKRRGAFLNGICSDAGVCMAFGKETATIKKHFDGFTHFRYLAKPAKRIGEVSANGFVKELTYTRGGYNAHAILKSTSHPKGDNLYYEYLVGSFINKRALQYPCFVETYGMFQYANSNAYTNIKNTSENNPSVLEQGLVPYVTNPPDTKKRLETSCTNGLLLCLLLQHIKNATSIATKSGNIDFVKNDLLYVLFQVYMPLAMMCNEFTHYDLHGENVLIYEPVEGSYIHYHYHMNDGNVVSFCSSYIAKIIDYGRSFFNDTENEKIDGSSKKIHDSLCSIPDCKNCGENQGYMWLRPNHTKEEAKESFHISSVVVNRSHDLRLINIIANSYNKNTIRQFKVMSQNVKKHLSDLHTLCQLVKYTTSYGTPDTVNTGLPYKIYNVMDACISLQKMITQPEKQNHNTSVYSTKTKLGDMHVYSDGRPLRFVAAV